MTAYQVLNSRVSNAITEFLETDEDISHAILSLESNLATLQYIQKSASKKPFGNDEKVKK